ncbi:MAG: HlyD family efflux transporter periplasmic adaptor subunit [Proteobacteria bacterium]|nr:HlyD family efflux transporter periplasmic adaptor subunit [Pseudomonadota bacterium]
MDTPIEPNVWMRQPLGVRVALASGGGITAVLILIAVFFGSSARTLRIPAVHVTIKPVEQSVFRDLIPLRAKVVPRDTIYLDAVEGGRVERVLVQPGEMVESGQRMIEFGNTNLQLQVIQQESQLNQAISQLQQNEIALEQNYAANARLLADIDYNILRLTRSLDRRETLAAKGVASVESREAVADELAHYKHLRPIQADSNRQQADLRARLLPAIRDQLDKLRQNLEVVRSKLDNLIVRAPAAGRVTHIDLKIGENRNPGQRLAEVTPETGFKLSAEVDEFYLARVHTDQTATTELNGTPVHARISRVYPQVNDGLFMIDLAFDGADPAGLVPGQALQGRLALGDDRAALVLASGAFIERTGGDWAFVMTDDDVAERRRIKIGRRSAEQVEIIEGLTAGERVITSDYTGYERLDRIVLSH